MPNRDANVRIRQLARGSSFPDVSPACLVVLRDRRWARTQRLHQVRPDLGRLVSVPEIMQIRPSLSECRPAAAPSLDAWLSRERDDMLVPLKFPGSRKVVAECSANFGK